MNDRLPFTILLSTYNGAPYLKDQLDSLLAQTHDNWKLLWRDDSSTDDSAALMRRFASSLAPGRCTESPSSGPHLGAAPSFLTLLTEAKDHAAIAFADQDDLWLPDKLAAAAARLTAAGATPTLYCGRQYLVDSSLRHKKPSPNYKTLPSFPAALTQNIATGNTLAMNRAAIALVNAIPAPPGTIHDWWSYIVTSACGGNIIFDPEPHILYRQHKQNLIGAKKPAPARALAALRRGPAIFMTMLRRHADTLTQHSEKLTTAAQADLTHIQTGLHGKLPQRLHALNCPRFKRQTFLENLLFRYWFLRG